MKPRVERRRKVWKCLLPGDSAGKGSGGTPKPSEPSVVSRGQKKNLFYLQDEAAEVAALLAAEHVAPVPESERDRLGPLDALTGAPLPDDVLLFALPVRMLRNFLEQHVGSKSVLLPCNDAVSGVCKISTHYDTVIGTQASQCSMMSRGPAPGGAAE